jgi:hypothetical protein
MRKLSAIFVVTITVLAGPVSAAAQSDLERARALYNEGRYDESIVAAETARSRPAVAPSATLIAARARLERFRRIGYEADLTTARSELVSLNPRNMAPQEAIEWQIGLGTALFLDGQPGPAAEMFAAVLPAARSRMSAVEFDKLLEWWASTLSRVAEGLSGPARKDAYQDFRKSVRGELEQNSLSRPANYWQVVALRGAGDLDGAWNAAVAAWIRAGSQPDGQPLRDDLQRFVTQTLIPERAQARTGQRLDAKATTNEIGVLTEEWKALTGRW